MEPLQNNSVQNTYLRSVMMSDVGVASDSGGPCDAANNYSSFEENNQTDADNVAILGGSDCTKDIPLEPMSPARRCCFIASLLLCILTVVVFVWVIPCSDEGGTCPAAIDRIKTHNWLNNYTKIELKAGVNIVTGVRSWENNLIFLYRGDAFFPEFRPDNSKRNGIISLIGSSGAVAWFDEMKDEPIAIDCTLLDVDRNGRPDCLVIDEYGELGAINPVSGEWHWRCKEHSDQKVETLDFPVILPDLDHDGVLDILMVTNTGSNDRQSNRQNSRKGDAANKSAFDRRNFLKILSGHSGQPIGEGFRVIECDTLRKLQLENGQTVSFNCIHNKTEAQRSKTLAELFSLITNKSLVGQNLVPASKISQHRHYGQRKDIDSQRNIYSLNDRELIVENRGKCPDDCNVTFILSENRNGKAFTVRNFTSSGMYGMVPAQWHFKNTKPNMSGFVMKFWKWKTDSQTSSQTSTSPSSSNPRGNETFQKTQTAKTKSKSTKSQSKDNISKTYKQNHVQNGPENNKKEGRHHDMDRDREFDAFEHVISKRSSFNFERNTSRSKRSSTSFNATNRKSAGTGLLMDNYKMQMITESVILVLFIGTETRIENTSQSNIIQFCRKDRKDLICQPDLNNQENSMLIADLDQDGSQELVSYMSTFVPANEDSQDWRLVTYVRLLRLQSELPAFYGDIKNN
uniref:FAM234A/B beta-propeller domain-containing protein n=2 Tax=Stomoxys calcitrans TaxID=35570 RepID=A0A1I8P3V7_STOCA